MKNQKIAVLGMGYIGLPTATVFAAAGYTVYGYDTNKTVIQTLKTGKIHIVEPDLQGLFKTVIDSGDLLPVEELPKADVFIICVPTPFKKDQDKKIADLSFVENATREVSRVVEKGNLIILESTVPPKTTEEVMGRILEEQTKLTVGDDILIAHCPERVLPGKILYELRNNDRIIGVSDAKAGEIAKKLYSDIVKDGTIYLTDTTTAEMCKIVENTYRDINIAFANELSIICENLGIDVWELIRLANKHPRVKILNPGTGVGGHCLAVDPWFIVEKFPDTARLIKMARQTNDFKPIWIAEKVAEEIADKFEGKKILIGILGLSYKPDIDDLRESPSIELAETLRKKGYQILVSEPHSPLSSIHSFENLTPEELIERSQYIVYTVSHKAFNEEIKTKVLSKPHFDAVGALR